MRLRKLMVVLMLTATSNSVRAGEYSKYAADVAAGKYENMGEVPAPIYPKYSYDITAHSNCILGNGKNARTPIASSQISTACRHKATPKKCRDVSVMPPDNESKSPQEICGEKCKSAGMWSRKYGDCSLD